MKPLRLLCAALLLGLTACGAYPADPDKTLERIDASHVVRVGVSHAPPCTDVVDGDPSGPEVDLVTEFARIRGARPEWTLGGEEQLMALLEEDRLDVVIGCLTKDSPWTEKAALTRPYGEGTDPLGKKAEHVVAVPLGENALVGALERFFDGRKEQR